MYDASEFAPLDRWVMAETLRTRQIRLYAAVMRRSTEGRRKLLVAKVGVATITYTVLASPIACNLPNPPPVDRTEVRQDAAGGEKAQPATSATSGDKPPNP